MITQPDWLVLVRAALAAVLGFIIGWEREHHGKPAGNRTYALVALGSAVFTAMGLVAFPVADDRIVAGVVTGVGFLGAGLIIRESTGEVHGLTTAASMWAVAGMGVVIGAGRYLLGVLLAILILGILLSKQVPFIAAIEQPARPSGGTGDQGEADD
jgi:putative Mg2+ transporter-C (MgtC) family protein